MFDFERFPVYQLSESFYQKLLPLLKDPKVLVYLKDQLDRSSSSISINIAEGAGKYSKKDKKNFYTIARGSVQECVSLLRIFKLRGYIQESNFEVLYRELETLSKMLSGLINKMKE